MTEMQTAMNSVLSGLGIEGICVRAEAHRHLAFFDIEPACKPGSIKKLERSGKEIAAKLRSKTIPIMRLVPDEGVVRLQVALKEAEPVNLIDLYKGEWLPDNMVLPFLLGEDEAGKKLWMDMNHNPHLLVAGGTGSGKSTLLHTLIANALWVHALRLRNIWLYLADPKRVEFTDYTSKSLNGVVMGVMSTYTEIIDQLTDLHELMESRYMQMNRDKVRSIEEDPQRYPIVLVVIDEVADLIMQDKGINKGKFQGLIIKLAQKGRAAGIFLVLATQRPSVDVITGILKANFPGRIACKTACRKDSEVVLDRPGAETLLGRGDAVLQNMRISSVRFQVAYTHPQETISMYNYFKERC